MAFTTAAASGAQAPTGGAGMAAGVTAGAGLADVFSMLVGQVGLAGQGLGAAPSANLLGQGAQTPATTSIFSLTQNLTVGEGQPTIAVTGDAATVASFVQQVNANLTALIQSGQVSISQLKDGKELATALTKLGLSADEATSIATRVETMLKVVQSNLQSGKTDAATADTTTEDTDSLLGQMAALLAAVMMPNSQATTPGTEAQSSALATDYQVALDVSQNTGPTQISVTLGQARKAFAAGQRDVLREVTGLSAPQTSAPASPAAPAETTTAAAPTVKVTVSSKENGETGVSLVLPQDKNAEGAMPTKAETQAAGTSVEMAAEMQQAVGALTQEKPLQPTAVATASRVESKDTLARPEGQTLYHWKSENGHETLKVVTPTSAVTEGGDATQQAQMASLLVASGGSTETAASATTAGQAASFAERVAEARQAQAAHQVQVQMKPLLEQGGGLVRMTLNPPEMGRVEIELHVAHGKVQGVLAATQPAVVEQLARELHSFRQGLQDAGLNLGEQGIALMLNTSTQDQNSQGQGGSAGNGRSGFGGRAATQSVEGPSAEAEDTWVSPDQLVDVRI